MSTTTITILCCDRCGHEAEIRQQADRAGWGGVVAGVPGGERQRTIGHPAQPFDVCPGCIDALFGWWSVSGDVVQPTAPPPRIRRFTMEDRQTAIDLAADLLRAQAEQAFSAARDEPTALLSGAMLPGGLHGVGERARAIVDAMVRQLEDQVPAAIAAVPNEAIVA